ncbi:hypothetical protein LRP49_16645 [Enterovibrio sp. ZSDZ35]|uniref:SnoaL-like domain-containing protein n=1 Tax=Enterovibrio qingdaonensis TaxID=2899818 RepID=A0ABT5QP92_9GAMM|nr:hypothetical protein [Enterovibrio sp. ZSDZ35]MDD1782803.1 hypothetical protein [Enterovibrio sp. ZSDZ35]
MIKPNPFKGSDADRAEIWDMLVAKDILAYTKADWSMVENDFLEDEFFAVNAGFDSDPGNWNLAFSLFENYRDSWLEAARASVETEYAEPLESAVHKLTTLEQIEIKDGKAIARKQFNGTIQVVGKEPEVLNWQTLYYLKKTHDGWKIVGFTGYLPYTA